MRGQSCVTRTRGPVLGGAESREESLEGRSDSGVMDVSPCLKFYSREVRGELKKERKELTALASADFENESCSSIATCWEIDVAGSCHPISRVTSPSFGEMSNVFGSTHGV